MIQNKAVTDGIGYRVSRVPFKNKKIIGITND